MSKIALGINHLHGNTLCDFTDKIADGCAANELLAKAVVVDPSVLHKEAASLRSNVAILLRTEAQVKGLRATVQQEEKDLRDSLRKVAHSVQSVTVDPSVLSTAGFPLVADAKPASAPPAVTGLSITIGDHLASLDLHWDAQHDVTYEIQMSLDPKDEASWKHWGISLKSSFVAAGLTSGTKMFFRILAHNAHGVSGPSVPASHTVP